MYFLVIILSIHFEEKSIAKNERLDIVNETEKIQIEHFFIELKQ